jgi:hypothetical protein
VTNVVVKRKISCYHSKKNIREKQKIKIYIFCGVTVMLSTLVKALAMGWAANTTDRYMHRGRKRYIRRLYAKAC